MIVHTFAQGSPEWYTARLGKFTASDAQAIANNGKGLETLCFEKVAEIKTGKAKENYTNEDMERGKELEELARNSYELETGIVVNQVGFMELDKYTGASPDGLIGEDGLQEIKCKNDANFARYAFERKIDPAHMWQMQMQMFVADRKRTEYVIYNPNFPTNIIIQRVTRDEEFVKKIQAGLVKGIAFVEEVLKKI